MQQPVISKGEYYHFLRDFWQAHIDFSGIDNFFVKIYRQDQFQFKLSNGSFIHTVNNVLHNIVFGWRLVMMTMKISQLDQTSSGVIKTLSS